MSEVQTGIATPGTDPIVGETPDVNSLAELGLTTPEVPGAEITTPATPAPATPAPDEDIVGAALKRGRPGREFDGLDEAEPSAGCNVLRTLAESQPGSQDGVGLGSESPDDKE